MMDLNVMLFISIGAFFGAISRYLCGFYLNKKVLPWGTLFVNLLGAFLLGFLYSSGLGVKWQLLLGTGFMGSFTTFSTFNIENVSFYLRGNWGTLLLYVLMTYGGGCLLAWIGFVFGLKSFFKIYFLL